MLIGIISDTHGQLRPEAVAALAGSDAIIHAGDIGQPGIIESLERIAPVLAVRGNIDVQPWALELPVIARRSYQDRTICVLHDLATLPVDAAARGYAAVISGHTHKAHIEWRAGVLYFNPGSAGPRRFRLPVTIGRLRIADGVLEPELVTLHV